jgi:hypothetical protein
MHGLVEIFFAGSLRKVNAMTRQWGIVFFHPHVSL